MNNKMYKALVSVRDWDVEMYKRKGHFTLPQSIRCKIKAAIDTVEENGSSHNTNIVQNQ